MDYTVNVGDAFILANDKNTGFFITEFIEPELLGEGGLRIKWFDDGIDGVYFEDQLRLAVTNGFYVKLSIIDTFIVKLKFAENL